MSPLVIVAAAAAALSVVGYLLGRRVAAGSGEAEPVTPIVSEKPAVFPYEDLPSREDFDDLSAKLDALVTGLEKNKAASPQYVISVGNAFRKRGFHYTASRLAASADDRTDQLNGIPYIIQKGDTAGALAVKYAGDFFRWKELVGRPSSKGILYHFIGPSPEKYEQIKPWFVGQTILLPLDWDKAPPQVIKPEQGAQLSTWKW